MYARPKYKASSVAFDIKFCSAPQLIADIHHEDEQMREVLAVSCAYLHLAPNVLCE